MRKKFTFLLMALLALTGFKSWGQENITVQIGTGAEITYNLPFNSYYGYSYNEMLIRASEINDAFQGTITSGTINSISFQAYWGNSGSTSFDFDIYMKNVDRTDYDDNGWETVLESDNVKSGTITSGVNDWVELTLDEPFQWDGTKNLLIVFDADNYGVYVKTYFYYDQPGFSCGHTVYSDNYNYEPSSSYPSGGYNTVVSYRPNIKLNMDVVTATTYAINLTPPDAAVGTISATPTSAIEGATVTLSANLNPGYELDSWTVTNATTSESIDVTNNQFTMPDSDVNVSVTYNALTQHNITVVQPSDQEEVGTFTADPTQAYKDERINLSYNLKQYDDHGYKFTSWTVTKTGDPTTIVAVDHDGQDYFTMPDYPVTVSAEYEQETYYALTIIAENGDVNAYPNQHITAGTMVSLNQYPDAGYDFGGWDVYYTENPDNKITVEYNQFEMPAAAVTVSATFTAKELYTVSIGTIENGTVSLIDAPAENKYYEGQQVKFNVTPDAGYMIDEVTYICDQTINICYDSFWGYYYFNMPEAPVTINASFIMGIMLHNSTNYCENIPVLGGYTNEFNTKSQFIYPDYELQAIEGTKITDLTFYVNDGNYYMPSDCSFLPLTWNVFMKEVDYTTQYDFTNWDNMTSVYNGTITVSGYKLTIHLSTPFEYNGGNLMIGFRQNEYGDVSQWLQWYGEYLGENYYSIATDWDASITRYNFLPKTTIIYEPIVKNAITLTQPDVEVGTIHAFANGVEVSQASEGTQITLEHNFNLGYRFNYWTVNGEQISGNTFTMPATAVTVAANYEALTSYDIICATLDEGTIHAEYNGVTISEAPAGTEITLVAVPNTGYSFDHFIVNGAPIDGNTYTMPDSEITVSATFLLAHTVYNGSSDNDHHPFYVYYADDFTKSNMIMPSDDLADMAGGTISSMKFYVSRTTDYSTLYCNSNWQVYLKEVDENETSAPIDVTTATKVYEGVIDFKVDEVIINFTEPFAYNGGNLLIATQNTTDISYSHVYFYGSDNAYGYNCSGYASNASSLNSITTWSQKSKFLPKTTFIYTPGATRYNVTCDNEITGGSISADPVKAAAGTVVNLSATPAFGYEFGAWVENYEDVEIVNNQFTMPEHDVNISATFSELPKYDIISATVIGGTVHAEYNDETITKAFAGTEITLVAEAAEGYIFEYFTVDGDQIEGSTYTIGTSDITIGASFRAVQSYNINYYVNGELEKTLQCREDNPVNVDNPANVPTGVDFEGWGIAEIGTYVTERPTIIGGDKYPTDDYDLHAVFRYSEMGGATAWTKVTDFSELNDNDVVIIGAVQNGNSGYTMNEFSEMSSNATCPALPATFSNDGTTITELPEGTTHFTITKYPYNYGGIYLQGESGKNLSSFWTYNLNIPTGWEEYVGDEYNDIITFDNGKLIISYNDDWDELYVILRNIDQYGGINMRFGVEQIQPGYYDAAYLYKQQGTLATYYMTEVLTNGEVTENTTAKNIIITTGTVTVNNNIVLTMNGNGLFRNENAAKFVFKDGAQLIYDGAETVNATMKKNIAGYSGDNDNYYLIANPTDNATVAHLTENNYDLYTFDPTQALEWHNEKENNTLTSGIGYLYANSNYVTLEFAGNLRSAADDMTIDLAYYDGGEDGHEFPGFNLVGNPFACNAYVYNNAGEDFTYYTIVGSEITATTGATIPCTGIFVEASEANQQVTFSTEAPEAPASLLSLTVSQNRGNAIDRAIVRFDGSSNLHKFMLNPDHTNLSIAKDGETFAAVSSETKGELPVSFKAETTGTYTISVNTENVTAGYIHLIDNMTGTDVDLLATPSYTFIGSPRDNENRFTVKFEVSYGQDGDGDEHFAYQNGSELVVNGEGTLQIFDILGRVVISEEVHGQTVYVGGLNTGAYIVRLTGESVKIQKIVVR